MPENKSRFVLVTQQAFALAVVTAVAISATGVVELEIVAPAEAGASSGSMAAPATAGGSATATPASLVSAQPVKPTVRTVPLAGATSGQDGLPSQSGKRSSSAQKIRVVSPVEPATGLAVVGVTWKDGSSLTEKDITVSVRSRESGTWSGWQEMHYDAEHAPDDGTAEEDASSGRVVRAGTDAVVVGHVDDVQVKAVTTTGRTPDRPVAGPGGPRQGRLSHPREARARRHDVGRRGHVRAHGEDRGRDDHVRGRRNRGAGRRVDARGPRAGHLLAGPVGRRRVAARPPVAALRRHPGRLRPPHRQRQRLQPRRGARHHARHLRLPHPGAGLERHRLQLPRRPVRPHLGGPVRRGGPRRGRRAHPELQRALLRHVGDRQLRPRPAQRGDGERLRRAVRLEALPGRHPGRRHPPARREHLVPGRQRSPGRRVHRLPRPLPLRPDPGHPDPGGRDPGRRRSCRSDRSGVTALGQPLRLGLARPRRPRRGHPPRDDRPHGRPAVLPVRGNGQRLLGRQGPGGRHRRPRRGRQGRPAGSLRRLRGDLVLPRHRGRWPRRAHRAGPVRQPRPAHRRR